MSLNLPNEIEAACQLLGIFPAHNDIISILPNNREA